MNYEKFHAAPDYQFDEKFVYDDSRLDERDNWVSKRRGCNKHAVNHANHQQRVIGEKQRAKAAAAMSQSPTKS